MRTHLQRVLIIAIGSGSDANSILLVAYHLALSSMATQCGFVTQIQNALERIGAEEHTFFSIESRLTRSKIRTYSLWSFDMVIIPELRIRGNALVR